MIRQSEFGNGNEKQIEKINKMLTGTELTKGEEKTLLWLAGWCCPAN